MSKITITVEVEVKGQKIFRLIDYKAYISVKKFHSIDIIEETIKAIKDEIKRGI
jgi:hypothetical protein